MTVFDILNLRAEYEELVLNMKVPGEFKNGTLEGLKWFSEYGISRNKKFEERHRAHEIALMILEECTK